MKEESGTTVETITILSKDMKFLNLLSHFFIGREDMTHGMNPKSIDNRENRKQEMVRRGLARQ